MKLFQFLSTKSGQISFSYFRQTSQKNPNNLWHIHPNLGPPRDMDVTIHTHHNITINLELSYFDSISDIKLQLQSLLGISTSRQALFHNNNLLQDDFNIHCSSSILVHNSHLNLIIKTPSPSFPQDQSDVITLLVQYPLTKRHAQIDTSLNNKVLLLKQSIGEKQNIPTSLLTAFLRGKEMDDDMLLLDCDGIERDDAVIELGLVGSGGYKIDHLVAKVVVLVANANVKIPVTLNLLQRFSDLRRQLERWRKENRISLPKEWFFVFGKERVMVECMAFDKFKIQNGDVLQVWSTMKMQPNTPETPPATTTINVEDASVTPSPKVQIRLKMPTPVSPISLEMSPNDTFSKLKDKIQDMEQIPKTRISLHFNNKDLHDQTSLREFDRQELGVNVIKQSPTTSVGSGASQGSGKRLKLMVLYKNGTERIPVEMNVGDNVGELRKELGRLQERMGFDLPAEGYFFIYKQNVMDDDKSFRWHKVGQGDVIEVFSGSVTGGS